MTTVLVHSASASYQWRGSLAAESGDPEGWHYSASSSQYWCFSLVRHEPITPIKTHISEAYFNNSSFQQFLVEMWCSNWIALQQLNRKVISKGYNLTLMTTLNTGGSSFLKESINCAIFQEITHKLLWFDVWPLWFSMERIVKKKLLYQEYYVRVWLSVSMYRAAWVHALETRWYMKSQNTHTHNTYISLYKCIQTNIQSDSCHQQTPCWNQRHVSKGHTYLISLYFGSNSSVIDDLRGQEVKLDVWVCDMRPTTDEASTLQMGCCSIAYGTITKVSEIVKVGVCVCV